MKASDKISSRRAETAAPDAKSNGSSFSTAERFALSGPSLTLDPRVHAYRKDIADIALAGQLIAPHYARALIRKVGAEAASLRSNGSDDADLLGDLQPGDEFAVLDIAGGWAWGYRRKDHLVGYVDAARLEAHPAE